MEMQQPTDEQRRVLPDVPTLEMQTHASNRPVKWKKFVQEGGIKIKLETVGSQG